MCKGRYTYTYTHACAGRERVRGKEGKEEKADGSWERRKEGRMVGW